MEALVPYAGTNRIRSAGISQPATRQHPDKKVGSLLELMGRVKQVTAPAFSLARGRREGA